MIDIEAPGLSEAVVRTVGQPLLILDADLRVRSANPAFCRTFQADPEETLGYTLFELGNGQWDIAALREFLGHILSEGITVEDFEVDHQFPELGRRFMVLDARRLEAEGRPLILLAIQDLTDRILVEQDSSVSPTSRRTTFRSHSGWWRATPGFWRVGTRAGSTSGPTSTSPTRRRVPTE